MRPPRDVAFRAGFYLAAALSGLAAAYVLKGWLPRLWEARNPAHVLPDSPDDKSSHSSPRQDRSPKTDPEHTLLAPGASTDPRTRTDQTKTLPPLRTHCLPPPLPSGHALFRSSFSINADTAPSPTASASSLHTSSGEDVEEDDTLQKNASDSLAESFVDVLSPPPPLPHGISRRRSVRVHDLFAESHMSFTELGSLVAPPDHDASK